MFKIVLLSSYVSNCQASCSKLYCFPHMYLIVKHHVHCFPHTYLIVKYHVQNCIAFLICIKLSSIMFKIVLLSSYVSNCQASCSKLYCFPHMYLIVKHVHCFPHMYLIVKHHVQICIAFLICT